MDQIGNIVQIIVSLATLVAMLFGGFHFLGKLEQKVAVIVTQMEAQNKLYDIQNKIYEQKFNDIEEQLKQLNNTAIEIAKQENRLNSMDERFNSINLRLAEIRSAPRLTKKRA